jgi:hypothetical protein
MRQHAELLERRTFSYPDFRTATGFADVAQLLRPHRSPA